MAEKEQHTGTNNSGSGTLPFANKDEFALLTKIVTRDLNKHRYVPSFTRYSKDDIVKYLTNPQLYEKQLRNATAYIYGSSPHFRRIIQYFVGLTDLAYIVEPYKIDPKKANVRIVSNNYRKVLNTLSNMNIRTQIPKILTVCLREDVFYGTIHESADCITIQQLPSDYCAISSIEGNVLNVSFDFSYFDARPYALDYFPEEFRTKYETIYRRRLVGKKNITIKDREYLRWIELDSPTSFVVKCNTDILDYAIPPFAGLLREIYDIDDYSQMKLAKTALENYAMIAMRLPLDEETGAWGIDYDKAVAFYSNLSNVLPEEVGSVLTPMELSKISFERSASKDTDTISEAEQNLFTAAGVSSLLFNNAKASANALLLSIKADQSITYGIVKSVEDVINRFIQSRSYGKYFRVTFLDCSTYNRKELGDAYLKAASYGLPTISMYAASQGLGQSELDSMSFLETEVLGLQDMFEPLRNSTQMSTKELESNGATDEGGAPHKEVGDLTDSGEQSREDSDDWG